MFRALRLTVIAAHTYFYLVIRSSRIFIRFYKSSVMGRLSKTR